MAIITAAIANSADPANTAELYSNGSFASLVSTMNVPRTQHTATLLNNGMVLIAGGSSDNLGIYGTPTTSADVHDPVAQAFKAQAL